MAQPPARPHDRSPDRSPAAQPEPRRGVIAILTDEYAPFQQHLVELIAARLDEAGFGSLCVNGGELVPAGAAHERFTACNGVYTLIERSNVQGVICLSGTLARRVGLGVLREFIDRFPVPVVNLGAQVPGTASIVKHERDAMTALMQHLLADERRQHFAFVRGFSNDGFSKRREKVFNDSLQRCHRRLPEPRYVEGEWDSFTAYLGVRDLLERHPETGTIVAANDTMALGAARAVIASGRSIPEDVAITGFDDTPEATRHSPPLTTVRQPIASMASEAARLLVARLSGQGPASDEMLVELDSELVVRHSTFRVRTDRASLARADPGTLHELLSSALLGLRPPEGVDLFAIAQALSSTLHSNGDELLACLSAQPMPNGDEDELHWWSNLCSGIESLAAQNRGPDGESTRGRAITAALWPLRERILGIAMEREFSEGHAHEIRADMQLRISSSTTPEQIVATLGGWMSNLEPKRAFLVLYQEPAIEPPASAVLMHLYTNGSARRGSPDSFPTRSLLPVPMNTELARGTLVLSPLYAGSALFGYLMMDPTGISLSRIDSAAHSIGNAMRNKHLIDTLEAQAHTLNAANAELQKLANFDTLTGLANRRQFQQHLDRACIDPQRAPMALCFLDLDGFKQVNDTQGHKAGDQLLVEVARRLRQVLSQGLTRQAFVARLGGDEFTVMLEGTQDVGGLRSVAGSMLAALEHPYELGGQSVRLSASIGAALFPDHADDASELLCRADEAMYTAKSRGKNRYTLYSAVHQGPRSRAA